MSEGRHEHSAVEIGCCGGDDRHMAMHPTASPAILATSGPTPMQVAAMGVLLSLTVALGVAGPELGGSPPAAPTGPSAVPTSTPTPSADPTPTPTPSPTASPTQTHQPTAVPTPLVTPRPAPATPAPTPTPPPMPAPTPPGGGLPACAYTDVLTPHHGYGDWPITLLDTIYHVPAWYAPGDLVDSSAAGVNGGYLVRSLLVADLRAMVDAARAAGVPIQLVSGYRSYAQQQATFDHWVSVGGYEQALRTSARAGHSEHQLGTTIDVTSLGGAAPWEYADWASTPEGSWMAANAWRYGFVMSYPAGASALTCYDYEPWHYRYVGRDIAARIAGSGLTPRQVLWELQ
jgi:D-alanyl-D-alanine carboxypeptidase